jgi:hypothetical protein
MLPTEDLGARRQAPGDEGARSGCRGDLARSATVAQHEYDRHADDRERALAIPVTPRIRWHANPPLDFLLADSRQKSVALAGHYILSLPGLQSQPSARLTRASP